MVLVPYNVPQAFREIAQRFADRTAIAFDASKSLTYGDLDLLSNRAAHFLAAKGIRRGERVAISLEKSPAAYALVIGSLKLGAPYVALDPRNPPARVQAILDQCLPGIVVTEREVAELMRASADPVGELDRIVGSDAAYLMFTSGSTGTPKGATISHDNLLHFIGWTQSEYGFTPEDVHTHVNPLHFDNSVFDMYSTFFTGGTLVPFDYDTLQDPTKLAERVRDMGCTTWFSVPSLLMFMQVMKVATKKYLGSLKRIIFGGEGFPKVKLKELFEELGSKTELHNVYGPTECTCICSSYRVGESDFVDLEGFPTLGHLAGGFTHLILDDDRLAPVGEAGELCLGGSCVGLGYFNRPELTAKAFVQNPLNKSFREILYRTGDLVRQDPKDEKLYFVGRRDLQVKHMGYRIELEEIQHALVQIQGVDEAAVLHKKDAELSELIAVVAAKEPMSSAQLREALGARVPKYMLPSKFHFVERLPKNANGKTDRTALIQRYVR
jgi:D-alanine--poly(phosphoribitol) ligase subunit 1